MSSAPKLKTVKAVKNNPEILMQDASLDIWDKKYRLKDKEEQPVDADIDATYARVAKALSDVEDKDKRALWSERFNWALKHGAIPAGRIISNAGAQAYKPATSTINCTVSGIVPDSMQGILERNLEAGLTLKAGCGIGYEFSTLRPKGAYVSGAGAYTSGPLSFMDIYDKMCFTVSSAGGRRGAQMATFDVSHPDVFDFVRAKREDGRLRQFNLSLLITEEFIEAVRNDGSWDLTFPISAKEIEGGLDLKGDNVVWKPFPTTDNYISNDEGLVACRIYETIRAQKLWNAIMSSTYDYAEPGFILIDQVNKNNNNWFCEDIRATNPCGEQPLPPYGSCLLGSVNLTKFVRNPFTDEAFFDWEEYAEVVEVFTRMLDNVVEINGLPLEGQRKEIEYKRRHGMGFLGLGSTITMLRMKYGDQDSLEFTDRIAQDMAVSGLKAGLHLAREKGPAPIMEDEFEITAAMLFKQPDLAKDGIKVGDKLKGKVLLAKYSRYMQTVATVAPELIDSLIEEGCRFSHHSSIAPTGTISLSLANNVSNGIEPSFAHHYSRNVIREGKKSKEKVDVFSYELLAYRTLVNEKAMPYGTSDEEALPDYFMSSENIMPRAHVDIQAAAQKWVDSSISKTINVPTDCDYEDFKGIYLYAAEKGLKGCTTFRFTQKRSRVYWSLRKTWRKPLTASPWKMVQRLNSKATKKLSTMAKPIRLPICLMH